MNPTHTAPDATDHQDDNTRPCLIVTCDGEADRIGDDATGHPYWWCATCGTEFQTSPEGTEGG